MTGLLVAAALIRLAPWVEAGVLSQTRVSGGRIAASADFGSGDAGLINCASGHCSFRCADHLVCATDPAPAPGTGGLPFWGGLTLDVHVTVTPTERGFTASFKGSADRQAAPNTGQARGTLDAVGLKVDVYAPVAAGQEVLAATEYSLTARWRNAAVGASAAAGVTDRCVELGRAAGAGVASDPSGDGTRSAIGAIKCALTPDGSAPIETADGPMRLIQSVRLSMADVFLYKDSNLAEVEGTFGFSYKLKGKELQAIGGPPEGVADSDPSFPRPFVVKVVQNDTGAAVAREPVVFQLKDLAGNAVGPAPTAVADTLGDGTVAVNFKVAEPGKYTVEAACAGCVGGSPKTFSATVLSEQEALDVEPVRGNGDAGFFSERLPNGLTARVINRITKARVGNVPVDFSLQPTETCKGLQSFTAEKTQSVHKTGLAHTDVTLGDQVATCTAIATCKPPHCMPSSKTAPFTFHVKRPASHPIDNGAPGNPFSGGSGGPAPVGARRSATPVDILYRVKTPRFDTRSPYRATRPPEDGYIGLLRGDEVGFKARAPIGSFLWSGYADGVSDVLADKPVTAPEARVENPAILTLHRIEGGDDARVRILVRTPPVDPITLRLLNTSLKLACDNTFPKFEDIPVEIRDSLPEKVLIYLKHLSGRTLGELRAMGKTMTRICRLHLQLNGILNFGPCGEVLGEYGKSLQFASSTYEPRGRGDDIGCHNNCCDAAKHMYWHAAAATIIGKKFAEEFGVAHEVESQCKALSNEVVMDLHNNELGHSLIGPLDGVSVRVVEAIKAEKALVLWATADNNNTSPLVSSGLCGKL